jgi:hypothetical protein
MMAISTLATTVRASDKRTATVLSSALRGPRVGSQALASGFCVSGASGQNPRSLSDGPQPVIRFADGMWAMYHNTTSVFCTLWLLS